MWRHWEIDGLKPPEGYRLDLVRGSIALRGYTLVALMIRPFTALRAGSSGGALREPPIALIK
jgi:hypothetical protein